MLKTYILEIYRKFVGQLRKITSYNTRELGGGLYETSPIHGSVFGYGRRNYMVQVDVPSETYNCQCCKFTRDGILCCHVMKVMTHLGAVHQIPQQYILPRWCIPPPDIDIPICETHKGPSGKMSRKDMRLLRYGNLCNDFTSLAAGAAASDKTTEVAYKHMKNLEKELADMKKAAADALRKKKAKRVAEAMELQHDTDATGSAPMQTDTVANDNVPTMPIVRDPPIITRRGRPEQKRKKGQLHLQPSRKTKCSVCGTTEHDARNCPVRIANPERYPIMSLFQ